MELAADHLFYLCLLLHGLPRLQGHGLAQPLGRASHGDFNGLEPVDCRKRRGGLCRAPKCRVSRSDSRQCSHYYHRRHLCFSEGWGCKCGDQGEQQNAKHGKPLSGRVQRICARPVLIASFAFNFNNFVLKKSTIKTINFCKSFLFDFYSLYFQ